MRVTRGLVALGGLAAVATSAWLVQPYGYTTWAGSAPFWLTAQVAAAAMLVVAAAVRWRAADGLLLLAGATWLLHDLGGVTSLPAGAVAVVDSASVVPAIALVLWALPSPGRWRSLLPIGAGALVLLGARLALVDPFLSLDCWRACSSNPFAIGVPGEVGGWVLALGAAGVVGGAVAGVVAGSRTAAVAGSVGAAPCALAITAAGSVLAQQVADAFGRSGPEDDVSRILFSAAQVAAVALGLVVMAKAGRRHLVRHRLGAMARHVQEAPEVGRLGEAVARILGDSTAEVRYWAPGREHFVDAEGRERPSPGPDDRLAVRITRGGRFLAVLVGHRQADAAAVHRALGPSLRLALENDQLRAASLAELEEIQQSRVRIAERAGEERRRLERNLHDGAQQRVLAVVVRLRMLRAIVPAEAARTIEAAEGVAARLLEDLRRLARGIHPAVVTDSGLAEALVDLADDSTDVVVSVSGVPAGGLSDVAQTTTYEVVAAALADARRRRATRLDVRGRGHGATLVLEICDDASERERAGLGELAERVRALPGRIRTEPAEGGVRLLLEVPCAS